MRSKGDAGVGGCLAVHGDLIADLTVDEPVEDPGEMRQVDPEHRGAGADERVERDDRPVGGVLVGEAVDEMNLGADGDGRAGRSRRHSLDDVVGRSDLVRHLDDLVRALRVHDHDAVGVLGPEGVDVDGRETLVHRAVALPEQQGRFLHVSLLQAAEGKARVHDSHVARPEAELEAGVAAEMLVGKEEHFVAAFDAVDAERPREDCPGVGRRADGAALAPDERLQRRRRVHVGHRHDALDVGDVRQFVPHLLDAVEIGHVGHRAPGIQVGQDDLLVGRREDVGRLGHEVHAAEHHELGVSLLGGKARQPERVAPGVGITDHVFALVVMPEDHEPVAQRCLCSGDAGGKVVGSRAAVVVGKWTLKADHEDPQLVASSRPAGTAWSPIRGCVGHEAGYVRRGTRPAYPQC